MVLLEVHKHLQIFLAVEPTNGSPDHRFSRCALCGFTSSNLYDLQCQIRKTNPSAYAATARISLVSSLIASLFLGAFATIEVSDASGMNLMNVLTHRWDDILLNACGGPELRAKLGNEPAHGGTFLGKVSNWWVKRWGFDPGMTTVSVPFSI